MAAAAAGLDRRLDTRGVAKPQVFDGNESNWPAWCFVFESYALLLGKDLAKHMDKAADLEDEPFLHEMANSANMKTVLCHRIHWRYLVLDEGHRIKNEKTVLV